MENGYLVNNRSQTPASGLAKWNKLWCNQDSGLFPTGPTTPVLCEIQRFPSILSRLFRARWNKDSPSSPLWNERKPPLYLLIYFCRKGVCNPTHPFFFNQIEALPGCCFHVAHAIVSDSGKGLLAALKGTSSRKRFISFIKELAMFWSCCLHSDFSAFALRACFK